MKDYLILGEYNYINPHKNANNFNYFVKKFIFINKN